MLGIGGYRWLEVFDGFKMKLMRADLLCRLPVGQLFASQIFELIMAEWKFRRCPPV
jgi:hypothetical protein